MDVIYKVLMNTLHGHRTCACTLKPHDVSKVTSVLCHEIHHVLSTSYINKSKANTTAYLIVFEVARVQGCESQNYDWSPPI
jgi:hypothetical protein